MHYIILTSNEIILGCGDVVLTFPITKINYMMSIHYPENLDQQEPAEIDYTNNQTAAYSK